MNVSGKTLAYQPRQISKIDADIFRELIFSQRALAVFPKDPSKKICFFEADSSKVIDKKFSFSLKVGQQKVDLSIELKPETPVVKRLEEVGGLESLPEEFRVALMTFASREIIDALEHLFQLPVVVWNVANDQEEACTKKELYFEIRDAHHVCEARASITLSMPLLERVLAIAQKTPMLKSRSLTEEILEGAVFIGSATISLEDWKNLHPGDLIVMQESSALTTGQGKCLIKKSGIIPMAFKPDFFKSLVLPLKTVFSTGVKLVLPAAEQQEDQKNSDSASIPLKLNFSAGLVSLTIEEAFQLIKTKSLAKPFQLLRPLKIFIQEQIVGTGELVKIGEQYVVAVTQITLS